MSIAKNITERNGIKYYDNGDPIGGSFYEKSANTDTIQGLSDMAKACAIHNLNTKAVNNTADIDWFDVFFDDIINVKGNGCEFVLIIQAFVNHIDDISLRPLVVDAIIVRLEYELSTCVPYKVDLQPLKAYKKYLCKVQNLNIPTPSTSKPEYNTARQEVENKEYLRNALQLAINNNLLTADYQPTEKTLCKSTRAYLVHAIYEYYNRGKKSGEWGYVPTEWKLFDQLFGDKNLSNTYHNNKQRSTNTCNKKIIDDIFGIR